MQIPNEIFHEILLYLDAVEIEKIGKILSVEIPRYIYRKKHRKPFMAVLYDIESISWYSKDISANMKFSMRKIPNTVDTIDSIKCIYLHKQVTSNVSNKFKSMDYESNMLAVITKTSIIPDHGIHKRKEIKSTYPRISILPPGDKSDIKLINSDLFKNSQITIFIDSYR